MIRSVAPFAFVETHVREVNKDNISKLLFHNWAYLFNYDHSNGGRIWVGQDHNVLKVDLLGSLDQIIHVLIIMVGLNVSFNASFVYGDNCPSKREALWAEIINCSTAQ